MARYKLNFTLYPRKTRNGRCVWYYRTYDLEGKRTSGKSTGQTSKTLARKYCEDLLKKNILYVGKSDYCNDFIKNFLNKNSKHYDKFFIRRNLSPNTIRLYTSLIRNILIPNLEDVKMSQLTPLAIEKLQDVLLNSGFNSYRVNSAIGLLSELLDIAVNEDRITRNPCKTVKPLKSQLKTKDSFSISEAKAILSHLKGEIYAFVLVSLCTGMRLSEIAGLKTYYVFDTYINVCGQRVKLSEYIPHTKTKKERFIPITPEIRKLILQYSDDEWCFTCSPRGVQQYVANAIKELGLNPDRNVSFHSFRHTFNTVMLSYNISDAKVSAVMGHSVGATAVRNRYTNFKIDDFKEVYDGIKRLYKELTE